MQAATSWPGATSQTVVNGLRALSGPNSSKMVEEASTTTADAAATLKDEHGAPDGTVGPGDIKKQGRIHGYRSRVWVGRGHI